ncbi:MAG: hypothetical protein ABI639_12600 [Thermoanaerobaculia bacterium]
MALPDHLADLERKVSARLSEALAEQRREMRRLAEAGAQRASSALLAELDSVGAHSTDSLFAENDLVEASRQTRDSGRRDLARALRSALVEFDRARTQGAVLEALLAGARPFADHAALFLMRPEEILGWASAGFEDGSETPGVDPIAGLAVGHEDSTALKSLAEGRGCILLSERNAAELAERLAIPSPRHSLLVPLILRDRVAAALYVDAAGPADFEIEALQALALAAAQRLELQSLATRSYTPTLFLEADAPEGARGLGLWNPDAPATSVQNAATEVIAATPSASSAPAAKSDEDDFGGVEFSGADAPSALQAHSDNEALPAMELVDDEPEARAEEVSSVRPATATPVPPVLSTTGAEPPAAAIDWQMEEADETLLLGSVPHSDPAPAPTVAIPATPVSTPTPTREVPFASAPWPIPDRSEWREADESTAPHAISPTAAATNFPPPSSISATNEFLLPPLAAPSTNLASTVAFVPPKPLAATTETVPAAPPTPPPSSTDAATRRLSLESLAPALSASRAPVPTPPSSAVDESLDETNPSLPRTMATGGSGEEPPTARGAKTTEVAPPPDLQGPGWAFTSTRSPRGSGDNALHEEARRLARLLVSEIKLYNEDQVEEGRHNRDIYHRLKDDIDRSRQIYEERVHDTVRGTTDYFQQELVRSLAGGDSRALGI